MQCPSAWQILTNWNENSDEDHDDGQDDDNSNGWTEDVYAEPLSGHRVFIMLVVWSGHAHAILVIWML